MDGFKKLCLFFTKIAEMLSIIWTHKIIMLTEKTAFRPDKWKYKTLIKDHPLSGLRTCCWAWWLMQITSANVISGDDQVLLYR